MWLSRQLSTQLSTEFPSFTVLLLTPKHKYIFLVQYIKCIGCVPQGILSAVSLKRIHSVELSDSLMKFNQLIGV